MDPLFSRMTKKYIPPMNRSVMEGRAVAELQCAEEFLDEQIRSICKGFPEPVKYVGYKRCTSQEEYEEITRPRSNKRTFDLAHSNVYMVQYHFTYTDPLGVVHPIVRYLHLPYVTRGGIIEVSGTKYHLIPILSDKVITATNNALFIRLAQDKNYMHRIYVNYIKDNRRTTSYTAWATIHGAPEAKKANERANKPKTTLAHYLFGYYGVFQAFSKFCNVLPVFGFAENVNEGTHPPESWVICKSTMESPPIYRNRPYKPNTLRLAIPREKWSSATEALVSGLFYVIDHFPDRFIPEMAIREGEGREKAIDEAVRAMVNNLEDKSLWMTLIGIILFGDIKGEIILYKEMKDHFESLDNYLDEASQKKLEQKGIKINDYYELLAYIAININDILRESSETGMNVYGMNLEILGYVFYDILHGFTSMKFALVKAYNRGALTLKNVTSNFQTFMKPGKIFQIINGKVITKAVGYSGDHMYPTITSVMTEQESKSGTQRNKKNHTVVGPQHRIELSMITVGSVLFLPKSSPEPLARVNPWICIDELTGTVIENPKLKKLIKANTPYFKF